MSREAAADRIINETGQNLAIGTVGLARRAPTGLEKIGAKILPGLGVAASLAAPLGYGLTNPDMYQVNPTWRERLASGLGNIGQSASFGLIPKEDIAYAIQGPSVADRLNYTRKK